MPKQFLRGIRIYSEQAPEAIVEAFEAGRIRPLEPVRELDAATIRSCTHIVGAMGHEPMLAALNSGAEVILAGRATDTAMVAAVALARGMPAGPTWHAAKTVECGGMCTTNPKAAGSSSPVLAVIDPGGFEVVPLHPDAACTPRSVAAHMLYENADPVSLREPAGTLDTSDATYRAVSDRIVRVEGSRFEPAPTTIKLEGARLADYETVALVGISDQVALAHIDRWLEDLAAFIRQRTESLLALEPTSYGFELRAYGHNAVLGALQSEVDRPPREVGVLLKVRAQTQMIATSIAKVANPALLHLPAPGMVELPSFAFATSPAEIERGAAYEFALNHAVEVRDGLELFRTTLSEVRHA